MKGIAPNLSLSDVYHDAMYMYWSCRTVLITPGMPHLTVLSIHPQQGPPNQLTLTEYWSIAYWGLRLFPRIKNTIELPVSYYCRSDSSLER